MPAQAHQDRAQGAIVVLALVKDLGNVGTDLVVVDCGRVGGGRLDEAEGDRASDTGRQRDVAADGGGGETGELAETCFYNIVFSSWEPTPPIPHPPPTLTPQSQKIKKAQTYLHETWPYCL